MLDADIFDDLTEPQRRAVAHTDGPLLVLAGAGSGKTRVITRRAAWLARTVARPDEVLAITFTNKAAGEMRDRIQRLGVSHGMWVCTFHSLCARLLRRYADACGIDPRFSIYDESDQRTVVREAIDKCNLHVDNWQPRNVLAVISDAKNAMHDPAAYAEQARDFSSRTIARIYEAYQRRLVELNACDFDDLLMYTARLLDTHADIRAELGDRFRYLLIDEYQDTNHAQYLIAARLAEAHRHICATGDPDQSIYAWRGANLQNILDFETDYPDAVIVRLEQNFRSTAPILSAASTLIAENQRRKPKTLWTERPGGVAVRVWTSDDEREEAERVAMDIARLAGEGVPHGQIAIFYRINALSRVLEDALRAARIPYQIARGVEFYSRKEIKDVLAYLRVVANPPDDISFLRALNTPVRGIGQVTVERLRGFAQTQGIALSEAALRATDISSLKSATKKIAPFVELLVSLRAMPERPVADIVEAVVRRSGIEAALRGDGTAALPDAENEPLANVQELVSAARQYDLEHDDGSLSEWLHQISLVSDLDSVELAGGPVTLMTLHAAKGLEFPVVYIVGVEDGLLPHQRALREGLDAIEEERRLCFVGMTRAMDRLILSHARYRMIRGISERAVASRFLKELPDDEIEREKSDASFRENYSTAHLGRYNTDIVDAEWQHYRPGLRVRHDEYGDGSILQLERRGRTLYVRVFFDECGERLLSLEHTPLSVLECE